MTKNDLNLGYINRTNSTGLQVLFPAGSNLARLDIIRVVQSVITRFSIGVHVRMYAAVGIKKILSFLFGTVTTPCISSGMPSTFKPNTGSKSDKLRRGEEEPLDS